MRIFHDGSGYGAHPADRTSGGESVFDKCSGRNPAGHEGGGSDALTGQIASFVPSPLIGENIEELGPRFPDMSRIYDYDLQKIAKKCAAETGADLKEGTYLQFTGPAYESPQEVANGAYTRSRCRRNEYGM